MQQCIIETLGAHGLQQQIQRRVAHHLLDMGIYRPDKAGRHGPVKDNAVNLAAFHDRPGDFVGYNVHFKIEGQVHRVSCRRVRRDERLQARLKFVAEPGDGHASQFAGIGNCGARPARIGYDTHTVSPDAGLRCQGPPEPVEVFNRMDTDDACLPEKALIHVVRAGQGARMAHAGAGPCLSAADILGQHGLAGSDLSRNIKKAAHIADALNVQGYGPGVFVIPQVFQRVNYVYVRLIAHADRLAEADAPLFQIGEDLGHIGTALGRKAQQARFGLKPRDRGVQRYLAVDDAHAVGPDKAYTVFVRDRIEQLLLLPAVGTGLFKTGGYHHRVPGAFLPELFHKGRKVE